MIPNSDYLLSKSYGTHNTFTVIPGEFPTTTSWTNKSPTGVITSITAIPATITPNPTVLSTTMFPTSITTNLENPMCHTTTIKLHR